LGRVTAMKKSIIKTNRGFVILFAVTVSAILLSIALGVTNIAQQEVKFNTSAKDTNNAFFAADTGIECAEINDKTNPNFFPAAGPAIKITCASSTANNITPVFTSATNSYDFVVSGLGGDGKSCAKVNIRKVVNADSSVDTTITSKGYNVGDETCSSTDKNRVERELQVTYTAGSSSVVVPPSADFPAIAGTNKSSRSVSRTHTISLPTPISTGDLLVAFFSVDNPNGTAITWPSGWIQMFKDTQGSSSYQNTFEARYKIATATETGVNKTIDVTTSAFVTTAHQSYRIINFSGTPASATAKGSNNLPNPPSLTVPWGAAKTLWLVAVGRGSGTVNSGPAGYTNLITQTIGSGISTATSDTARHQTEVDTENPGNYTLTNTVDAWIAATIAIQGYVP